VVSILVAATAVTAPSGCKPDPVVVPPPPKMRPQVMTETLPPMPAGHPDLGALKLASRGPRRLSVDQIERSLDTIGNLPKGTVKLPPDLAVTLGRPDFERVTEEALDPSPLFMKFMVDLGAFACNSLSDAEPNRPVAERLMTRSADIDENLRFMLLRFTAIEGEGAAPYLTRLRAAYDRATVSAARPRAGYEAVCIALFTSPEFLLY
jgi:hypothetical protein